ncbi:helix-turn-helix domain-containing protein [Mycobacteroides abscessus subsp. abscessus]|jgi:transcriptional regulator with XRE-family HTH domain|uniref:helix-turn-helix domain-containing protein n=1 Tax=Mycobacteroides abscessus TaxID=36809 RepID=UPI0009299E09|nr:helix-turn-helix domain-containing protein [Mycobacteroides abscessus]SIH34177.1 helix-turn-helix domain-containing protein [Mycobacteroides abscessus subsp. abscessus]
MRNAADVLNDVMKRTGTTQTALAQISGVRQPSISQYLSGKLDCSDEQLGRLLSCMGYRLEITRRPIPAELTRSEQRSWALHKQLAKHLSGGNLQQWAAQILANIKTLRQSVRGQPHQRNLDAWETLTRQMNLPALRHAMTGLDRGAIEMREVSPLSGILSEPERLQALKSPP